MESAIADSQAFHPTSRHPDIPTSAQPDITRIVSHCDNRYGYSVRHQIVSRFVGRIVNRIAKSDTRWRSRYRIPWRCALL
jgi:hypothetical protein